MKFKYFHIATVIWIIVATPLGFAESFPNRPVASELDGFVISGTQCARGMIERCQAVQVTPPFVKTNSAGWYLNQSLMGTIASTARSLIPYYANPSTVYSGTTNIMMLTVTGVWAQVGIGNHTNQFTSVFASGTNSATYGDTPGQISQAHLNERYYALNACRYRPAMKGTAGLCGRRGENS